jgi:hypothetical protein
VVSPLLFVPQVCESQLDSRAIDLEAIHLDLRQSVAPELIAKCSFDRMSLWMPAI